MFTLLPQQNKKNLFKQYRTRLFIVGVFFVTALLFASSALLFPSYIFLFFERGGLQREAQSLAQNIKTKDQKGLVQTLTQIDQMLVIVKPEETRGFDITKVVLDILPSGIRLQRFTYTRGEKAESSLSIQGVASTRASLLEFSKKLQETKLFSKVDLPISNLAKQSDVPFSLTLLGNF